MDKSKLRIIAPVVMMVIMLLIAIILIAGKDAVIGLLTPEDDAVRYAVCLMMAAIGAFIVYMTLKHIDLKKK